MPRWQTTSIGYSGCGTYRFIISGLSVQIPMTGSRHQPIEHSAAFLVPDHHEEPFTRRLRDKIRRDETVGRVRCPFPAQMDDLGTGIGGGHERVFADANENRDGKARIPLARAATRSRTVSWSNDPTAANGTALADKQPHGRQRGGSLLDLDIKATAGLNGEVDHLVERRHAPPRASGISGDIRGIVRGKRDPPAVRGGHRIVVGDHDDAVAGKTGVELPHVGSETRGDPERGQRVLIGMGTGAAMANAERAFDGMCRPAIALDEFSDQRLQSSIRLSPCLPPP